MQLLVDMTLITIFIGITLAGIMKTHSCLQFRVLMKMGQQVGQ